KRKRAACSRIQLRNKLQQDAGNGDNSVRASVRAPIAYSGNTLRFALLPRGLRAEGAGRCDGDLPAPPAIVGTTVFSGRSHAAHSQRRSTTQTALRRRG